MAVSYTFYKNDGTSVSEQLPHMPATPFPDPAADFGWSVQGKTFKGWNTKSDGSGTFFYTGDTIFTGTTFYAIWEAPVITYLTTDRDLTSIANAIRAKGGTSSSLEFPNGFVDAIDAIPSGGGNIDPFINRSISAISNSTVTTIGSYAFADCDSLKTASFPAATFIRQGAFLRCNKLTEVNCSSVTIISSFAFASCYSLIAVNFPAATSIGGSAFTYCKALSEISFPSVSIIETCAFSNCYNLKTAYFPAATSVKTSAFEYCSSLTTANFPALTNIGGYAFASCKLLTTINFPVATNIGGSAFAYCSSLNTIYFSKATTIGTYAFQGCYSLTTVSFPAITSIASRCFAQCYHLLSFYLLGSSYCSLANMNVFSTTPISTYTTSTGGIYGSIFVRESMYSTYIAMTNWAAYSARFVSLTDAQIAALDT